MEIRTGGRVYVENFPHLDSGAQALRESVKLEELLMRVADGDQDAFTAVYDRTAGPVFGMSVRMLQDRARAEEVAHDTLLSVWANARRFDMARGSARGWIFTLAHARAVDAIRHDRAAFARERRHDWLGVADPDPVGSEVIDHADRERVRQCLSALTSLQRQAVTMAYYEGHTYAEIANLTGGSLPAVITRIRDALIRLRHCLPT